MDSIYNRIQTSTAQIMGILNVTPDSFFDGGKYNDDIAIEKRIEKLISDGADIIDIGGYSSRPGAKDVETLEEIRRVESALKIIKRKYPDTICSIDTFRSEVAEFALKNYGECIINDISAANIDANMLNTISKHNSIYIAMHMIGTPKTMQLHTDYDNLIKDILKYFEEKIKTFNELGISKYIIDPGFGFSKTLDQNYELLSKMEILHQLNCPILVGISRKSMIYNLLETSADKSLNGTTALNMYSLEKGAKILRVHDVKEAKECLEIHNKLDKYRLKNQE
ncbi:MAG: dihydropteroate synthase [Marinifilaceae bacterium]|jgi:dihydropteroate synthase|nr:dihydropteroate synthase [Marinifilaceae bacterium]